MKNYIAGVLTVLLLILIGGGGYLLGKESNKIHLSNPTPVATSLELPTPTPKPLDSKQLARKQIIEAVVNKSYTGLENLMASTVVVRKEQSGCCGSMSRKDALAEMDFLATATGSWKFEETNAIILSLKASNPENYGGDSVVGISTDNFVVGFQFNTEGQITKISMGSNYQSLIE